MTNPNIRYSFVALTCAISLVALIGAEMVNSLNTIQSRLATLEHRKPQIIHEVTHCLPVVDANDQADYSGCNKEVK